MNVSRHGRFSAEMYGSFLAPELAAFVDQLTRLDEALTGEAELQHLEGEYGLTIKLEQGRGTLAARVRAHLDAELRTQDLPITQADVHLALSSFRKLANQFPVR